MKEIYVMFGLILIASVLSFALGWRTGYDNAHGNLYGPVTAEMLNKALSGGVHHGDEFIKCVVAE